MKVPRNFDFIRGKKMNCDNCWNYKECKNKNRSDLVLCFKKGYTCRYCKQKECKSYNTNTQCFCTEFIHK